MQLTLLVLTAAFAAVTGRRTSLRNPRGGTCLGGGAKVSGFAGVVMENGVAVNACERDCCSKKCTTLNFEAQCTQLSTPVTCDNKVASKCVFQDFTRVGSDCVAPSSATGLPSGYKYSATELSNYTPFDFYKWLENISRRSAGEKALADEYRKRCREERGYACIPNGYQCSEDHYAAGREECSTKCCSGRGSFGWSPINKVWSKHGPYGCYDFYRQLEPCTLCKP